MYGTQLYDAYPYGAPTISQVDAGALACAAVATTSALPDYFPGATVAIPTAAQATANGALRATGSATLEALLSAALAGLLEVGEGGLLIAWGLIADYALIRRGASGLGGAEASSGAQAGGWYGLRRAATVYEEPSLVTSVWDIAEPTSGSWQNGKLAVGDWVQAPAPGADWDPRG